MTIYTSPVSATNAGYVSLGNGPLAIAVTSGTGIYVIVSDTAPAASATGHIVYANVPAAPFLFLNVASQVWVRSIDRNSAFVQVTQLTAEIGSPGKDYSANRPALPNVGANFGGSGPYANYVLVATVPANALRSNVEIENTSGAAIAILRDDGTAASGAAPANASVFALAGGSGAGAQGGAWASKTFKGRLQIYAAASSAQIAVFVD